MYAYHDTEIEISDDVFILKEEDAKKLQAPPALAELGLNRTHVTLKSGDQATVKYKGFDQYGQVIATGQVNWSATGGTIDSEGHYTAGVSSGQFAVIAMLGAIEAVTSVVVQKDVPTPDPVPPLPGKRTVRWSDRVPPQKWMNFYSKILSKMASNPDLILKISFELPTDRDQADQVSDDAKTGLMELGLDDDVQIT